MSLLKGIISGLIAVFLTLSATAGAGITLQVYTEEFPPYNFVRDGIADGVSTRVVEAVLQQAGLEYRLISLPWARSLLAAQSGENRLIYSISRRREREALFQWVGVVVPSIHSVFSLNSRTDIQLTSLADMKRYRIGTIISGARETWLLKQGFSETDFQRISGDKAVFRNYELLKRGRIDLWPVPDAVAFYVAQTSGDDPRQLLRKSWEFSELSREGYYLAASLETDPEIISRLREALIRFQQTADYRQILRQWGLEPAPRNPSR